MPNYRRLRVDGGCWFFTANLLDRRVDLLVRYVDQLHRAIVKVQQQRPFVIDAWVILPDHLHMIWTLPPDDSDFPSRWRDLKVTFSRSVPKSQGQSIWQRGYWEHLIRDDRDYDAHVDYCWVNPVKHGLVQRVEDWPHSSFHEAHWDLPSREHFERRLAAAALSSGGFGERE